MTWKLCLGLSLGVCLLGGCTKKSTPTPSSSATPGGSIARRVERFRKNKKAMDTNHDGKISEEEEEAAFDRKLKKSKVLQERLDLDEDGQVSEEERKIGLTNFRKRLHRHRKGKGTPSPSASPAETPE